MATVVRLAGWEDRVALAGLRAAWTEENAGTDLPDDGYLERFEEWLAVEQHQRITWLGLVDGEPVAMLNLLVFTRMPRPGPAVAPQWGYLANFYVRPEHRVAGLGSALLAACTAYGNGLAFARIVLSPSERSVPLYARAGFAPATSLMLRPGPE